MLLELNRVKETYGPEYVLFFCGDPKEPRGAMQRVATLFGSPTYGSESSTCAAATWMASQLVTGQLTMGSDPTDDVLIPSLLCKKDILFSGEVVFLLHD